MTSKLPNTRSVKVGDPRILAESTVVKPATLNGVEYGVGSIVRMSAHVQIDGKQTTVTLPSMAELMYYQADSNLIKASKVKSKSLKTATTPTGYTRLVDEEQFYIYIQLVSLGILGLYSALETMVYELYIRKYKDNPVTIDGKELSHTEFTNKGFDTKLTKLASQLSKKENIYGTNLMALVKEIKKLRTIIQHWDIERREDYFINLPDSHPIKKFINVNPTELSQNTRTILDHYKLG